MRNRVRTFFFSRIFAGVTLLAFSLCLTSFYLADDFLTELQSKYDRFIQTYPVVKLNMVFNQSAYAPGDTAYFKAWYQQESDAMVNGTHIITLDLISGEGRTLQKTRFKVKDGSGVNQMVVDANLPAGLYKVVGYSDWMKNFGPSWYYISDFVVTKSKAIVVTQSNKEKKLQFFVEGERAIAGTSNRFVGLGAPGVHASVVDNANRPVMEIDFDSTGLSLFEFSPEINNSYQVVWGGETFALPVIDPDGVSLRLNANASLAHFSLPSNSKWSGDDLFGVVMNRGRIVLKRNFKVAPGTGFELPLPQENISGSFAQLYVFDKRGTLLASRVYASGEEKKPQVTIQFPEQLSQRAETSGTVSVVDNNGNPVEADLTVSVFQKDLFEGSFDQYYSTGLTEVDRYKKDHRSISTRQINAFLITQKWKRINWEVIQNEKPLDLKYSFNSQFGLKGQVVAKSGVSEAADSTTVIAYLQENTIGYEGYTRDGRFVIPFVLDFFGKDNVFFTLQNRNRILDEDYAVVVLEDSVNLPERWESKESAATSLYGSYEMKREIVSRSYSFFEGNGEGSKSIENPNRFFEDEFLGVDFEVNVSEYVIFPTMIELVREVVPFVQHRKRKSGDELRLSYRRENTTHVFQRDPLYIMDGAMTRNTAFFLSLKPEDLLFVKVINHPNKLSQLGKLGENGIIFIESKKGDLASKITNKNYFQATGINRVIPFPIKSGVKAKEKSPDLRPTLYWNPSLKTNSSGTTNFSFSTSDDLGPVKIVVRGISKDGVPFKAEKEFRVEPVRK